MIYVIVMILIDINNQLCRFMYYYSITVTHINTPRIYYKYGKKTTYLAYSFFDKAQDVASESGNLP